MTSSKKIDTQYPRFLQALILKKLTEEDLMIGTAYRDSDEYAILSLNEYDRHNVNMHLYCSKVADFYFEIEDHDSELEAQFLMLDSEDLKAIPDGLKALMLKVAQTGRSVTFRTDQISN